MALCSTACAGVLPAPNVNPCRIAPRKGGISRFVFLSCDAEIADLTKLSDWSPVVAACKVRITGEVVGEKPAPSVQKKRVSSCLPEITTGKTHTLKFTDYNHDYDLQRDYAFWCELEENASAYRVGFFGCDGYFTGFYPFGLEVGDVKEDTAQGTSHFEGVVTIEQRCNLTPVAVPDEILQLLLDNINTVCETEEP